MLKFWNLNYASETTQRSLKIFTLTHDILRQIKHAQLKKELVGK